MKEIKRLTLLTNPDKCNWHCPLCFLNQRQEPFFANEMDFSVAKFYIEKYEKTLLEVIPSTMGEPLLYTHFDALLLLLSEKKIKMNLTTNGSFPFYSDKKMKLLLESASDIKISVMGFSENAFKTFSHGFSFATWKKNLQKLASLKRNLPKTNTGNLSLQVTLHKKNIPEIQNILNFAKENDFSRIKWNKPVFLFEASKELKEIYSVSGETFSVVKDLILKESSSLNIKAEGNLFFNKTKIKECPFQNELWILPNGKEEFCPNPERRFGNTRHRNASCKNCILFQ